MSVVLLLLAFAGATVVAEHPLAIYEARIDGAGVLSVRCGFSFRSSQRVYSWRGSLQPAVDRLLFVDLRDDHDQSIDVQPVPGFVPEFPNPRDVASGTRISYAEPIRMIARRPESKLNGCFRLRVRYEASRLAAKYRRRGRFDSVSATSEFVRVCSP